jgi:hypothetical protein
MKIKKLLIGSLSGEGEICFYDIGTGKLYAKKEDRWEETDSSVLSGIFAKKEEVVKPVVKKVK